MKITMNKECMNFGDISVKFGASFEEVHHLLNRYIYTEQSPNADDNSGFIVLVEIDFYGLRGRSTLYFIDNCLYAIGLRPVGNQYDLVDEHGIKLSVYDAVQKIARISESGLKEAFGEPAERSKYGDTVYYVGDTAIITSTSRYDDNYSVMVKNLLMVRKLREKKGK